MDLATTRRNLHEASCGLHPLIQLDCLPGWPGEVKS